MRQIINRPAGMFLLPAVALALYGHAVGPGQVIDGQSKIQNNNVLGMVLGA